MFEVVPLLQLANMVADGLSRQLESKLNQVKNQFETF
jgi:hypothetical protein